MDARLRGGAPLVLNRNTRGDDKKLRGNDGTQHARRPPA